MTAKEVRHNLKRFFAFLAWRIGLSASEPVKCQCNFCAKWVDIMKLKAFRRMQEKGEAEWLCCPACEGKEYPLINGWRPVGRQAVWK